MAPVKGLFSGRREPSISTLPAVDGFFSEDFKWYNGDTTMYYRGNVPEEGRAYVISIGGTARSLAGEFLDGNGDGTGGGTRTAST
jgi:hypothetical protein